MAADPPTRPELPSELLCRSPAFEVTLRGPEVDDRALSGLAETCVSLSVEECQVVGGGLHGLRERPLSALRLKRCPLTPGGFRKIGLLTRLRTLHLVQCPLPVSWVQILSRLPALETLVLTGSRLPEGSFRGFEKLARLRRLVAHGPSEYLEHPDPVDDEALSSVAKAPSLVVLDLWRGKRVTDAGLQSLSPLAGLRRLSVGDPDDTFSPSDAAGLGALAGLEVLELFTCGRGFTAAGLQSLEALPRLDWLFLEACHLAPALTARLEAGWVGLPKAMPTALARWWRRDRR